MRPVLVAMLVVLGGIAVAVGAAGVGAAQDGEEVLLEVELVDDDGDPITNRSQATVTVEWDDEDTNAMIFSDGIARADVPEGADITVRVTHEKLIKNHPIEVEDYDGDRLEATLFPRATAIVGAEDEDESLRNVSVELEKETDRMPAASGLTDENGEFTTPEIEEGDYEVRLVKPGYRSEQAEVTVTDETEVEYELTAANVNLDIRTQDNRTEEAIGANISVRTNGNEIKTAQTSAERGIETLSLPVNDDYTVRIQSDGYRPLIRSVDIEEADREITLDLTREPRIRIEPGNTQIVAEQELRVEVTDEYGDPVEGATVSLNDATGETNEDGVVTLTPESVGEYNLTAEIDELEAEPVQVSVVAGDGSSGDRSVPGMTAAMGIVATILGALVLARRQ